jgi:hypothetical protein
MRNEGRVGMAGAPGAGGKEGIVGGLGTRKIYSIPFKGITLLPFA